MEEPKSKHLKRCKACNRWTDGAERFCVYCGHEHNKEQREEIAKRRENGDLSVPVWKIHPNDPLWLKIIKKPVQIVQLVLYGIIAFLVYLSTAFAH